MQLACIRKKRTRLVNDSPPTLKRGEMKISLLDLLFKLLAKHQIIAPKFLNNYAVPTRPSILVKVSVENHLPMLLDSVSFSHSAMPLKRTQEARGNRHPVELFLDSMLFCYGCQNFSEKHSFPADKPPIRYYRGAFLKLIAISVEKKHGESLLNTGAKCWESRFFFGILSFSERFSSMRGIKKMNPILWS